MINLFKNRKDKDIKTKLELAKKLNGQSLKCVTERINGIEEIVGRDGAIIFKDDILTVHAGQNIVVNEPLSNITIGELLSLEGALIQVNTSSEYPKTFVAYYKYWRNLNS